MQHRLVPIILERAEDALLGLGEPAAAPACAQQLQRRVRVAREDDAVEDLDGAVGGLQTHFVPERRGRRLARHGHRGAVEVHAAGGQGRGDVVDVDATVCMCLLVGERSQEGVECHLPPRNVSQEGLPVSCMR